MSKLHTKQSMSPPTHRPWALQHDGDLKQAWWQNTVSKGPKTVTFTWAKGHATDKDIEDGRSTETHRQHTNAADKQADLGVHDHTPDITHRSFYIVERSQAYTTLMKIIQKVIINMLRHDQQARKLDSTLQSNSTIDYRNITLNQAINWATENTTRHTTHIDKTALSKAKPPPKATQVHKVASFLHNLEIKIGTPHDPGITWLELLIAYEKTSSVDISPPLPRR